MTIVGDAAGIADTPMLDAAVCLSLVLSVRHPPFSPPSPFCLLCHFLPPQFDSIMHLSGGHWSLLVGWEYNVYVEDQSYATLSTSGDSPNGSGIHDDRGSPCMRREQTNLGLLRGLHSQPRM